MHVTLYYKGALGRERKIAFGFELQLQAVFRKFSEFFVSLLHTFEFIGTNCLLIQNWLVVNNLDSKVNGLLSWFVLG